MNTVQEADQRYTLGEVERLLAMKQGRQTDQLYTLGEVARILRLTRERFSNMVRDGEALGPDVLIPGGGHKAARWSATRVDIIKDKWALSHAA